VRRRRRQINAALVADLTRRADGELQTIRATAAAELGARARASSASLAAAERAAQDQVRKTPNWPRSWANFSLL
jgi:hypothetical protein